MAEGTPKFASLLLSNLVISDTKLGTGSDANVYLATRKGTPCAAKRLHDILLEDETPGGALRLISNFEAECTTWSKLRHPGVVQFFGVHLEGRSRLPILVMERMDTSLRKYLEDRSKEEFSLWLKAFVLRQVTQALAYLHGQQPPLVHHDLSTNNILLNVQSFIAKVTDFGMSRAIQPFSYSRRSSIKGTLAFMPPEALHHPLRYNESLDVFSFGNVIISTVTHEWPNPGPPTQLEGGKLVAVTEVQRREHYTAMFTPEGKDLFLATVHQCLDNDPDKRPTSVQLVGALEQIEASLPGGSHDVSTIVQLQQQLAAKEEECRQALSEKEEALKKKDEALAELREKNEELSEKEEALKEKDEALNEKDEIVKQMAKVKPVFEDVQSALVRYGIEVESWEDVPQAVQQLAHKHGKEPLPGVLLQTVSSSDVFLVLNIAQVLTNESWPEIAGSLGCSRDYVHSLHYEWEAALHRYVVYSESSKDSLHKEYFIHVIADWTAKKEGTGSAPRNWKKVLESIKALCISSKEAISRISVFESRLIHGGNIYSSP